MDAIDSLGGDQAGIATRSVNRESILLKREWRNGILAALVVSGFAIVFIELEAIVRAGENVEIEFFGILDSAPTHFGPERDDGSRFGEDGNIFEFAADRVPLSTRQLFSAKEIKPLPLRKPDLLRGASSFGVDRFQHRGSKQLRAEEILIF